ncbi:MAG: hypothetical protein ACRDRL_19725 [Sciscionella sp.]
MNPHAGWLADLAGSSRHRSVRTARVYNEIAENFAERALGVAGAAPRQHVPERSRTSRPVWRFVVTCTELYTHYLLGDRDLETFEAFVLKDLTDSVVMHDRYHLIRFCQD